MQGPDFQKESAWFREIATQFGDANPSLAPQLTGSLSDPDVERLLDAAAFQNSLLSRKLDADFPEIVRNLAHLVLPHYVRPVPPSTIIGFTSSPSPGRSVTIPAGTGLASIPVEGTRCRFKTTRNLEVHPLELTHAAIVRLSERATELRLSFLLRGLSLSQWRPGSISLFLGGDLVTATQLYQILCTRLRRIIVTAPGAGALELPPGYLKTVGYDEFDSIVPYPSHAFPGYRLFQEYFNAPEKFLFFVLDGWEHWKKRGDGSQFTVSLRMEDLTSSVQKVGRANVILNAVPAVNLYSRDAVPIFIDHRASRYLVRPCGPNPAHHAIYSVDGVTGFSRRTGREREYGAFELFDSEPARGPVYHVGQERSPGSDRYDSYLCVTYPCGVESPVGETLSLELTCTNGSLPKSLRVGDVHIPESRLPESVSFSNITPVNPGVPSPLGQELQWRLATHLYLNHVTLGRAAHLETLLKLYLFPDDASHASVLANRKRISGIEEITVISEESMIEGVPVRGRHVRLKVRRDHFAGAGDLYLFGCVLDRFLAEYASINCFTRLTIVETIRGECYRWPMRLG
jgi:type VI secretion system protein ImpG